MRALARQLERPRYHSKLCKITLEHDDLVGHGNECCAPVHEIPQLKMDLRPEVASFEQADSVLGYDLVQVRHEHQALRASWELGYL